MIVVPEFFADRLVKMEPAARVWLDGLPELAARCAERWELRAPMQGYGGLVLPAVDFGWPAVQAIALWGLR